MNSCIQRQCVCLCVYSVFAVAVCGPSPSSLLQLRERTWHSFRTIILTIPLPLFSSFIHSPSMQSVCVCPSVCLSVCACVSLCLVLCLSSSFLLFRFSSHSRRREYTWYGVPSGKYPPWFPYVAPQIPAPAASWLSFHSQSGHWYMQRGTRSH